MLPVLKNSFQGNLSLKGQSVLSQRLQLVESFLGVQDSRKISSNSDSFALKEAVSTHSSNGIQVDFFLTLQTLAEHYRNPLHYLALIDEILSQMWTFRFHTFGEEDVILFEQKLKQHPLEFLKPLQFKVEEGAPEVVACIKPHPIMKWSIFFNPLHVQSRFKTEPLSNLPSYLEYTFLHELTHLIQFELNLHLDGIKVDSESKVWQDRWHEQEAMYVSECVVHNRLFPKKSYLKAARQLTEELSLNPSSKSSLSFKDDVLTPYYQLLKTQQKERALPYLKVFQFKRAK